MRALRRHRSASRTRIVEFQNQRLRRLVAHAYAKVPYYRRLFDAHGLTPRDIQTVADLHKIPLTSRDAMQREAPEALVATGMDPRRLIVHNTSGSSGKPLNVRRTWMEERILGFLRLRALHSFGLRATDRRCAVRAVVNVYGRQSEVLQRLAQRLGLLRRFGVDGYEAPAVIVRRLAAIRPRALHGPPMVLARIAEAVGPHTLRSLPLKFVTAGGAVLTPLMRRQIEDGFGRPLYEMYGAHEFNLIAWQCRATGELHCCEDGVIVEVLRDGRPASEDEPGEMVGTALHSFAMPFIRYRLGDIVTAGRPRCRCGQPFATIRAIQGRTVDYFHLPGGRVLHPFQLLNDAQKLTPWIREYQVTQERVDRIVVRIVASDAPTPHALAAWRRPTAEFLGPGVEIEVELVSALPDEGTGKFRVFRSLVEADAGSADAGAADAGAADAGAADAGAADAGAADAGASDVRASDATR